ncbi:MAG: pentapeptide repeat-containing protein [Erythrobacter sp.]
MGYQSIPEQVDAWRKADPATRAAAKELGNNIREAVGAITQRSIGKAQRDAVRDERRTIFGGNLPLTGTVFDGIKLPPQTLLAKRALDQSSFIGANLLGAHLEGANLRRAHLEGANLWLARLGGADLQDAHLEGANLWLAHLDDKTDLTNAAFDEATIFATGWSNFTDQEKTEARAPWIARGMKHVRELEEERKARVAERKPAS